MNAAGIDITDIDVKTEIQKFPKRSNSRDGDSSEFIERKYKYPVFIHRHGGEDECFELGEESDGTRRMFLLAFYILDTLKYGRVLIIDELEASLHPALAAFIIKLFNSTENKNGAQLIFSTHNTGLLDIKKTFRRDQIWFMEKDSSQATVLYSLADFATRKDAAVESGYLTGRYGAIPFLTDFSINYGDNDDGA